MSRRTALVVCPGRGVYNASELGYLTTHHADKTALFERFDTQRTIMKQPSIVELDRAERFSKSRFTRGDNASGLIYSGSIADFLSIDRDRFDIVAVTGNSMGWYTALACGGAVSAEDGFLIVNTMGTIMHRYPAGGQIVYPAMDEQWLDNPDLRQSIHDLTDRIEGLSVSIRFGGMLVLAGTETALKVAEAALEPIQGRFPMRLHNHSAFHTSLMAQNSSRGFNALPETLFQQPALPMIDGQGKIWMPGASERSALWSYTFGDQVVKTYDFTHAVQTGLKEFAPDVVIVLGPGNTLGGATAQAMLMCGWDGMTKKDEFIAHQAFEPNLLAMGHKMQRSLTVSSK